MQSMHVVTFAHPCTRIAYILCPLSTNGSYIMLCLCVCWILPLLQLCSHCPRVSVQRQATAILYLSIYIYIYEPEPWNWLTATWTNIPWCHPNSVPVLDSQRCDQENHAKLCRQNPIRRYWVLYLRPGTVPHQSVLADADGNDAIW